MVESSSSRYKMAHTVSRSDKLDADDLVILWNKAKRGMGFDVCSVLQSNMILLVLAHGLPNAAGFAAGFALGLRL